ncbi:protein O-GlcNAc transferase [uncultured Gammaproteobacteria bacterium]
MVSEAKCVNPYKEQTMATVAEAVAIAIEHHQAGRLADAEQLYHRILEVDPHQPDTLHLLGVLAAQTGHHVLAADLIGRAVGVKGLEPLFQANLASVLVELGRLEEAAVCCRFALALQPDNAQAKATLASLSGAPAPPAPAPAPAPPQADREPEVAGLVAAARRLLAQGQVTGAVAGFRRAAELQPESVEILSSLGVALQAQGELIEAIALQRRAVGLRPDFAGAHYNLGAALMAADDPLGAEAAFRAALDRMPELAEAWCNLATLLNGDHRAAEAEHAARQALAVRPGFAEVLLALGNALKAQGRLDQALVVYGQAVEHAPGLAQAHANLGVALREQGQLDQALTHLTQALNLGLPDSGGVLALVSQLNKHLCRWQEREALSARVLEIVRSGASALVHPFNLLAEDAATAEDQLLAARRYTAQRVKSVLPWRERLGFHFDQGPRPGQRLRIGYLSADFHQHATALLIADLIECHDRKAVEVFGYSYGPDDGGPLRSRLKQAFDGFTDLAQESFAIAAQRIYTDRIDILIDLKGHTQHARPEILALRPAPVQVAWLGYPGTSGAEFIDYALVDAIAVPADLQPFFSEKLVHLPVCYQPNDRRREIADTTPPRSGHGLPADGLVFCCFNALYKISPTVFEIWMALLAAVPGSVLWLLDGPETATANLRREAAARGIAPERLVFAPHLPSPKHLARHRHADLFLDTFPVSAHTTASDALWAGLPLITCRGQTMAARVAASLLHAVGLPQLATASPAEYRDLALALARDPVRRADLRRHLAECHADAPLFDTPALARALEAAYAELWATWARKS